MWRKKGIFLSRVLASVPESDRAYDSNFCFDIWRAKIAD